jgi:hypothetical protein
MKRNLLTLLLLCFVLTVKAQSEVPGQYKYVTENNEKLPFNFTLSLNWNKTFVIEDSTTNSIGKGTWKVKKDTTLILSINYTIFRQSESSKKMRLTYFIRNGQLHEEIMTRKQYNKLNKKLDKEIQSCLPGMREDYEQFKIKQENRYLKKTNSIECL